MNFGTVSFNSFPCNKLYATIIGQPVAWATTDTEDTNTYGEFFKAVQARVPDATIDILMTDDDK